LDETQGFLLTPPVTRFPEGVNDVVRPDELRQAGLHYLKRERIAFKRSQAAGPSIKKFRIMTYNVHGCRGMDGRISASRIAEVIERYHPDIVALQELDLGRARSERCDQPREIAEALGMDVHFCAAVVDKDEQYGHALLSRWPMTLLRTDVLFGGERNRQLEPRGALWVTLDMEGAKLNLMNTHFGLWRSERREQVKDLLGEKWIGGIDLNEPLIVCGDFNMGPRSRAFRDLCRRLRDVQTGLEDAAPLNTFATFRPFLRLDHIFVSRHFRAVTVRAPRNYMTRVASDHLPLIADLIYREPDA
jgi:endonuclease/exonuclease/phosphatase family metal-dependent hydrolase